MRPLIFSVLLLALPAVARAEDFLAGGTYYYKAHLEDIKADTVVIVHKGGRTIVPWASLSTELQRRFAKEHQDAIKQDTLDAQAKDQAAKMQAAGLRMLGGTVISIVPNEGILLQPSGHERPAMLRGYDPKGLVDGDPVPTVVVTPDGTFSYNLSNGMRATVHAYKVAPAPTE